MNAPIVVDSATLCRHDGRARLEALVDGQHLFWSMPDRPCVALRGEPFLALLLVPAMAHGRDIRLTDALAVDPMFVDSMHRLQRIFQRWFPGLRPVRIEVAGPQTVRPSAGRFAGYSGGVDSSYTVMELTSELDGVVLIDGIEFAEPRPELVDLIEGRLRTEMARRDLDLIRVETNAKAFGRRLGGRWSQFIGGSLASIPHALGVREYTIAASNSWENLRAYGTHPMTDPMWSSTSVRIHHHGVDARRIDKLEALANAAGLLSNLRVCFQGSEYNCGVCHKCLQTSAALRALRLTASAVPSLENPRLLRRLTVEHHGDLVDWLEIVPAARAIGDDVLAAELVRLTRRFQWRRVYGELDHLLTGGAIRRMATRHQRRRLR